MIVAPSGKYDSGYGKRPFLYRCPNTGQRVQAYTTDDLDDDLAFVHELSISSATTPEPRGRERFKGVGPKILVATFKGTTASRPRCLDTRHSMPHVCWKRGGNACAEQLQLCLRRCSLRRWHSRSPTRIAAPEWPASQAASQVQRSRNRDQAHQTRAVRTPIRAT
jgi:hypothetical protein